MIATRLGRSLLLRRSCLSAAVVRRASKTTTAPFKAISPTDVSSHPDYGQALERSKSAEQDYSKLRLLCEAGGGEKGAVRHVQKNKKVLVRDRLKGILDDDDVLELNVTAGMGMEYGDVPCAGSISMMGKIRGTTCIIVANDATVKGNHTGRVVFSAFFRQICQETCRNFELDEDFD